MDRSQPTEQLHVRQLHVKCRTVYATLSVYHSSSTFKPWSYHFYTLCAMCMCILRCLPGDPHVRRASETCILYPLSYPCKLQTAELSTHFFHFSPLIPRCTGTLLKPRLTCENKTKILPSKCLPEAPALQSKVWRDLFGPPSELCGLVSPACISGPLQ